MPLLVPKYTVLFVQHVLILVIFLAGRLHCLCATETRNRIYWVERQCKPRLSSWILLVCQRYDRYKLALLKFSAKGKRELVYLQIFTHPTNGSHLGMALAEFKTTQQAMDFYEQCGSNPKIMGFGSKIFVDTLGFWITDQFLHLTGQEVPSLPPRRELFTDNDQLLRIRELIRRQNLKGTKSQLQNYLNFQMGSATINKALPMTRTKTTLRWQSRQVN